MTSLPQPEAKRGEATAQARDIARFADSLEHELERWHPFPPSEMWSGIAADRQRDALQEARTAIRSVVDRLRQILAPLMSIEHALDEALGELVRLQRECDDAEFTAESRRRTAGADRGEANALTQRAAWEPGAVDRALAAEVQAEASSASALRAEEDARNTRLRCATRARALCSEFAAADLAAAVRIEASFGGGEAEVRTHLEGATSAIAQAALAQLPPAAASTIARGTPRVIASSSFAPFSMRYEANRALVRKYVEELASERARIVAVPPVRRIGSQLRRLEWIEHELEINRPFLDPGRQLLTWDPHGDGILIEVMGNASTASHIAVVVPGITNTIANFDHRHATRSRNVFDSASALDRDTAVIAWLGYDTPGVMGSVSKHRAVDASRSLTTFIDGLPADRHVSLVAHSYGTVVAGLSAETRLAVDELILVGSPGTPLDHARRARLDPGARIWTATSDSDLVGRVGPETHHCPEVVFGLKPARHAATLWPSCRLDADGDVLGLVHGRNPSHSSFGAIEIDTTGVTGHSGYFDRGTTSLESIARIVVGAPVDG